MSVYPNILDGFEVDSWGRLACFGLEACETTLAVSIRIAVTLANSAWTGWSTTSATLVPCPHFTIPSRVIAPVMSWISDSHQRGSINSRDWSSRISLEAFETTLAVSIRIAITLANSAWALCSTTRATSVVSWHQATPVRVIAPVMSWNSDSHQRVSFNSRDWSSRISLEAFQPREAIIVGVTVATANPTWTGWSTTSASIVNSFSKLISNWTSRLLEIFGSQVFKRVVFSSETHDVSVSSGEALKIGECSNLFKHIIMIISKK